MVQSSVSYCLGIWVTFLVTIVEWFSPPLFHFVVWCLGRPYSLFWSRCLSFFLNLRVVPFVYGISRIITGIGSGGSVPIAFTRTSGSFNQSEVTNSGAFLLLLQSSSWLVGPVLFYYFLRGNETSPEELVHLIQGVLFVLSLPPLFSVLILLSSSHTVAFAPLQSEEVKDVESAPQKRQHISLVRAFLGTGICWFLYDLNVSMRSTGDT